MFDIKISSKIKNHCEELIRIYNFGNRGIADGSQSEQLTGLIGQNVLHDLFELPLMDGKGGFDDGEDINFNNLTIDVKTMGRTVSMKPFFVHNLIGLQIHYPTQVYIFCSLNKDTEVLTVCGWVTKEQHRNRAEFFSKGTWRTRTNGTKFSTKADLYEIRNDALNDVTNFEDLKQQLNQLQL